MASLKDLIVLGPARFLDKIYGNLEGNASSANKLKTARSITLTGTVNGTAAFDGSSNIAITTSLAKNYAGSSSDGGVANNSNFLNRKAHLTTAEQMDNFLDVTGMQYATFKLTEDSGIGFAANDGMLLSMPWSSTNYGAQIAFDDSGAGIVAIRGKSSSWGAWYKLLHSGNYTTYTVSKTGSGASGNWGINITGSAAKLTTARTINGTSFDGSANITTANWGTTRNITIGNKTNAINGSTDYNYTHLDIGLQDGYFRNVTRDFTNGTLIQTSIDYSNTNGAPWSLEIKGNSYGSYYPFLLQYQGYIYNDTIIHHGGNMYGYTISGLVAFNCNGKLCFWFPRQAYWQGFAVLVVEEWGNNAKTNTVTNISDSVKPSGITKEVTLDNFHYYLHHGNYSSYLDSRYVTLSTSQTITASKIITSNWYFKTTNYTSTPIQLLDDGTNYGHTMLIGAGGTTYIGAGESASTLYSKLAVKSTEDLILGADSSIRFHTGADSATTTSGITLNTSNYFYPQTNNTGSLGTSSYKWASAYASTFYGALSGNASTATAFSSNRTIALAGAVTGSASANGASGWSITATIANKAVTPTDFTTTFRTQTKGDANSGQYLTVIRSNNTDSWGYMPQYGSGIAFGYSDTQTYLYTSYSSAQAYIGGGNADKLNWIKRIAFTDGTGASGSWGISVTGSSASCTGNAATATKLANARNIELSGDFTGSASFNGTANAIITATNYKCTVSGGNTNSFPYHRIAYISGKTGQWTDCDCILDIKHNYNTGGFGRVKVSFRSNGTGTAVQVSATWLYKYNIKDDAISVAYWGTTGQSCYADVFYKVPSTYPRCTVYQAYGSRVWTLVNSNQPNDSATATEAYASISAAATALHGGTAYTDIVESTQANSVGILPISGGGTGASTATAALTNLGGVGYTVVTNLNSLL